MNKNKNPNSSKHIYSLLLGAYLGAIAWAVYALLECYFVATLSWLFDIPAGTTPPHAGFGAALYVIFPIMGATFCGGVGLFVSLVSRWNPILSEKHVETIISCFAPFSLVVAFLVNVIAHWYFYAPLYIPFFIAITVYSAAFVMYVIRPGDTPFRSLLNPYGITFVLLGFPLLPESLFGFTTGVKVFLAIVYFGVIWLGTSLLGAGLGSSTHKIHHSNGATPKTAYWVVAAVIGVALNVGLQHNQRPAALDLSGGSSLNGPNVLLITWDTVRADHLSLHGYERNTTPNLDKFAATATVFPRAAASGDMTLSTHASIFTGVSVRSHRAHFDTPDFPEGRPLSPKFDTLAEQLAGHGYRTIAIAANHAYLTDDFGMSQGFDYFNSSAAVPPLGKAESYFLRQGIRDVLALFVPRKMYDPLYRNAEEINAEAIQLVKQIKTSNAPIFMFLNYMDAHDPYLPPPPYDTEYPGKDENFHSKLFHYLAEDIMKGNRTITTQEREHLDSQYDGAIAYMDNQFGQLIAALKETDLYDETLIILTSDHGEVFGERRLFGHGISVYQDQVHVPLVIKFPNQSHGKVNANLVSSIDILPTILEIAGIEASSQLQGQSLNSENIRRSQPVVSEHFTAGFLLTWSERFRGTDRALFDGDLKIIRSSGDHRELYNLAKDPDEQIDLSGSVRTSLDELDMALDGWLVTSMPRFTDEVTDKNTQETVERLKTLGYVK